MSIAAVNTSPYIHTTIVEGTPRTLTLLLLPCLSGLSLRGKKKKKRTRREGGNGLMSSARRSQPFFFLTVYSTYLLSVFFFLNNRKRWHCRAESWRVCLSWILYYIRPLFSVWQIKSDKTFFLSPFSNKRTALLLYPFW
jgi:hypothetical protein